MANILLGICGGIAAYKALDLASFLTRAGHEVKCILTSNAQKFVPALSFETIIHNTVETGMFPSQDPIAHINMADWADILVVAPATANIMAKAACGITDDLLSSTILAYPKPVLYVPAMNVHMYEAVITQQNISKLRERGNHVLEPDSGMLACGYVGKGKYPPTEEIMAAITTFLHHEQDLVDKKVLITTGATREAIDPMRFISNKSSGKMGLALARAAWLRGAKVVLIAGIVEDRLPYYLDDAICVTSAQEMYQAVMDNVGECDWIIKCAAVADYRPERYLETKTPKKTELKLNLKATPDILQALGKTKLKHQKLIGFAAQTGDLISPAIGKLKSKQLDLVCANDVSVAGRNDTRMILIGKMKGRPQLSEAPELNYLELCGDKLTVAHGILDTVRTL